MSKMKAAADKADKENIDLQAATLVGDIRDQVLSLFKNHADWKHMKETSQRDVATVFL
jgi:hypothetical protein